jgi:DNA-binding HxlR family transcriptional regulator
MIASDGRGRRRGGRGAPGAGGGADGGLRRALGRVGDRWTLLVVSALLAGPRRFNELQGDLEGIAPNVLSQRLRQLEADGLVVAHPYSERPMRYAYELTATGSALAGALRLLAGWGAEHGDGPGSGPEPVVHEACGTAAEARWWCPTCDRVLDDSELDELRWV